MSDLAELYRDLVLDHGGHPRNREAMPDADRHAEGYNPLCGDRIEVFLRLDDGRIERLTFLGEACAICTASASMMSEHLAGRNAEEARASFAAFQRMVTAPSDDDELPAGFERLAALAGVRRYPMRVKCATLPWHTMKSALDGADAPVTTE